MEDIKKVDVMDGVTFAEKLARGEIGMPVEETRRWTKPIVPVDDRPCKHRVVWLKQPDLSVKGICKRCGQTLYNDDKYDRKIYRKCGVCKMLIRKDGCDESGNKMGNGWVCRYCSVEHEYKVGMAYYKLGKDLRQLHGIEK